MPVTVVIPTFGTNDTARSIEPLCHMCNAYRRVEWVTILISLIGNVRVPCCEVDNVLQLNHSQRNQEVYTLHRFEVATLATTEWILHMDDDVMIAPEMLSAWVERASPDHPNGIDSEVRFCDVTGYNTNDDAPIALTNMLLVPSDMNRAFTWWMWEQSNWSSWVVQHEGNGEDLLFSRFVRSINRTYTFYGVCGHAHHPQLCQADTGQHAYRVAKSKGFHSKLDHFATRGSFCRILHGSVPCDTCYAVTPVRTPPITTTLPHIFVGIPGSNLTLIQESIRSASTQNYNSLTIVAYLDGLSDHGRLQLEARDRVVIGDTVHRGPAFSRYAIMQRIRAISRPMDFVLFMDGDDRFLHDDAVTALQRSLDHRTWIATGYHVGPREYECVDIKHSWSGADFRAHGWRYCHPRMFRAFLIGIFKESDFLMDGEWLEKATDRPLMYKLLEAAGARHYHFSHERAVGYYDSPESTLKRLDAAYVLASKAWTQRQNPIAPLVTDLHVVAPFGVSPVIPTVYHRHVHYHLLSFASVNQSRPPSSFQHASVHLYRTQRNKEIPFLDMLALYVTKTYVTGSVVLIIYNQRLFLQDRSRYLDLVESETQLSNSAVRICSYESLLKMRKRRTRYVMTDDGRVLEFA